MPGSCSYQDERLPATRQVIMRNRRGGPEEVIDIVESRAPNGFANLHDVIDPAELESIVTSYARAAGASQQQVNSPA